ncbi:MAG: hypothetical protein V3R81_07995, partial [Gammaproteobacteria bacterium]
WHFTSSAASHRHHGSGARPMYYLFFTGAGVLGVILVLFWLKDVLQSPKLARIVYSELVARFALVAAAFSILGLLLILADYIGGGGN